MRVLVVDDSPSVGLLMRRLCTAAGHEAAVAHDAAELSALLASGAFDAAAVDLMMPDMAGGLAAVAAVQAAGVPKVVVMTGADEGQIADAMPLLGAVAVIRKPMVPELLRTLGVTRAGDPCQKSTTVENVIPGGKP